MKWIKITERIPEEEKIICGRKSALLVTDGERIWPGELVFEFDDKYETMHWELRGIECWNEKNKLTHWIIIYPPEE